jgi:hypothetical protein
MLKIKNMKFRIIEVKVGNQTPYYIIKKQTWLGFWKQIERWNTMHDMSFHIQFSSIEEATAYVDKHYPTNTKVIKEIVIT